MFFFLEVVEQYIEQSRFETVQQFAHRLAISGAVQQGALLGELLGAVSDRR
jgi:hypothetical protein